MCFIAKCPLKKSNLNNTLNGSHTYIHYHEQSPHSITFRIHHHHHHQNRNHHPLMVCITKHENTNNDDDGRCSRRPECRFYENPFPRSHAAASLRPSVRIKLYARPVVHKTPLTNAHTHTTIDSTYPKKNIYLRQIVTHSIWVYTPCRYTLVRIKWYPRLVSFKDQTNTSAYTMSWWLVFEDGLITKRICVLLYGCGSRFARSVDVFGLREITLACHLPFHPGPKRDEIEAHHRIIVRGENLVDVRVPTISLVAAHQLPE